MNLKPISAPFFPYRGGKALLRRFVVRWLPLNGSTYYEPFAGRANVFFLMKRISHFDKWVLNDLQTFKWLSAVADYDGSVLPEVEKQNAKEFLKTAGNLAEWMEPILTWAGGLKEKSSVTGSRGHKLDEYAERLKAAKEALSEAEITKIDAIDMLSEISDPESLVYLDPPYQGATVGSYDEKMLNRTALIEILTKAKFRWVLSEYECDDLNLAFGKPKASFSGVMVNPNPGGDVRREVEVLYSNLNFDKGPNVINFEDSERPFKTSINLLKANNGLSFEVFNKICPCHWGEGTRKAQYARLRCLPDSYFDGEVIWQC